MATNTRNKLSVYTTQDISATELTENNTFIPAFKPGTNNYKVPVSSFYGTFQPTSGMTAYYDKDNVYNKEEVNSMLANFGGYKVVELVDDEPDVTSPDTKTIYLTKDDSITSGDSYKEWIWKAADPQDPQSTSAWDLIGDTSLDLTPYVQLTGSYTSGHIARFGYDSNNPDSKLIEDTGYTVSDFLTHDDVPSIGITSGNNTVYSASNVMMYYKYPTTTTKNIAIAFSGMPGENSSATSGFLVPEPNGQHKILATSMSNTLSMYWTDHPIPRFDLDTANNVLTVDSDGLTYGWMPLPKTRVEIDIGPSSVLSTISYTRLLYGTCNEFFQEGSDEYNTLTSILDNIDTIYNMGLTPSITFIGQNNSEATFHLVVKQCGGYIFSITSVSNTTNEFNNTVTSIFFGPYKDNYDNNWFACRSSSIHIDV